MRKAFESLRDAEFAAALPWPAAVERIRHQTGRDFSMAHARAGFGRGHLLDIVLYLPGCTHAGDCDVEAEDFIVLLLGEEIFNHWLGEVTTVPATRRGPLTVINSNSEEQNALPIQLLPESIRAAISGLRAGLPPLPCASSDSDDWVAFELEPKPASDFAAQNDLVFCSTRVPELKKCFLRGLSFFSGRFTTSGALFVYLKYDSDQVSAEARLAERARFEAAILAALRPEQGVLVGVGLGVRYGYLDLAIVDPDCVSSQVIPALRAADISRRSWFLFCDSYLELESIGVYPDSPRPLSVWEDVTSADTPGLAI